VHYVVIIAAHCESTLGLLESWVWVIQCEYFTHWESIIFHIWWIVKYIFFYKPNQLHVDYDLFWMIWLLLSILKLWRCFEVWIWYVEFEWMVWLYVWLGVLKTIIALEHECDFRVSIKFVNMMHYVPQEHSMVTYVPQEHNLEPQLMVLAYAYIYCDVMECVACLIYCSFAKRISCMI